MNLTDFLSTANADDETALGEAHAFVAYTGKLIHRNTMNSLLTQSGVYTAFKKLAADDGHPWQDAAAAFLDSTEFNFMQSDTTGMIQIGMLDQMIASNITVDVGNRSVDVSTALVNVKATAIAIANTPYYPFATVTLEQIKSIRLPPVTRDVTTTPDGFHTSTLNSDSFRFSVLPASDFTGTVSINVYGKKAGETEFTVFPQIPIVINREFEAGKAVSTAVARTRSIMGYTHFKFAFDEPYANAVSEVTVEVI